MDENEVIFVRTEEMVWPNGALGCLAPGKVYAHHVANTQTSSKVSSPQLCCGELCQTILTSWQRRLICIKRNAKIHPPAAVVFGRLVSAMYMEDVNLHSKARQRHAGPAEVPDIGIGFHPVALRIIKEGVALEDRKSTRLNSSHSQISYAVFCLKKK